MIAAPFSAVLHLLIGWEWTIAAGVLAGALAPETGGRSGLISVGAAWGGILLWSLLAAPDASAVLLDVLGGLVGGNTPGAAIVALTLVFGALLGLAGGFAGSQARLLAMSAAGSDKAQGQTPESPASAGSTPADA
jgi:hypothetical protein